MTALHRNADALAGDPAQWMPWNYSEALASLMPASAANGRTLTHGCRKDTVQEPKQSGETRHSRQNRTICKALDSRPTIMFLRMTVGAESVDMVWAERVYIKVAAVGVTAGIPVLVSRLAGNHISDTRNIHVCNYDL